MILILQPDDVTEGKEKDKHVLMTIQPRIAAGSLNLATIPVGMLDNSGTFSGSTAKEIEEESGLKLKAGELIDMAALALADETNNEGLQKGVY